MYLCFFNIFLLFFRTQAHSGPPVGTRLRRAHSASRAYGVPYESKLRGVCFPLHRGSPTEAREKPPKDRNPSFRISCEKEKH